jgi:hypothetical protein
MNDDRSFVLDLNETEEYFSFYKPYKIINGSRFTIGENRATTFPVDQHFNWFQKLMWKWCFGVKVEDYSEE